MTTYFWKIWSLRNSPIRELPSGLEDEFQHCDGRLFAAIRRRDYAAALKGNAPVPQRSLRIPQVLKHKRHADMRLKIVRIEFQGLFEVLAGFFELLGLKQEEWQDSRAPADAPDALPALRRKLFAPPPSPRPP